MYLNIALNARKELMPFDWKKKKKKKKGERSFPRFIETRLFRDMTTFD